VDSAVTVLIFLAIPVFIGLAIWSQYRRHQRLLAWAASVGWTYVGTDPSLADRWHSQPFGVGHGRRVSELMTGRFEGRSVMSFGYRYSTSSGKSESTYTFHVVSMALPAYLPNLELTPEGLGARIARTFGGQDIQFESEDFNRAWRVRAGDIKFAHDVLHPRLMERLLRGDVGFSVRIEGTDILSWTAGSPRLDDIAGRMRVMHAVIDAIPRYVWLDHGYDPGTSPPPIGGAGNTLST